jgi:hypothetical protein
LQEARAAARVNAQDAKPKDPPCGNVNQLRAALLLRVVTALIPDREINPALIEKHLCSIVEGTIGRPI